MGRRKKDIDPGVVFHMLVNRAPIAAVAKHCKCHPDTIFANFKDLISEARLVQDEAWLAIHRPLFEEKMRKREEERNAKMSKRKNRRGIYQYQ